MSSQPTQLPKSTYQSITTRLLVGVLLISFFAVALASISLIQSRVQYQKQAETTTQNLSRILVSDLAGSIDKISVALFAVSTEYERQLNGTGINSNTLNEYIKLEHKILPYLDSLRIADAQGIIAYGIGVTPDLRTSIADRDYFKYLRDTPHASLAISKPLIGKISGKWVIIFARRINKADGSFAGVAYAAITLDYLSKIFSSIDIGSHGSITLRYSDLGLVARFPADASNPAAGVGQKVVAKETAERIQAGQTERTYQSLTPIDKIERVFTYRKIYDYPFYIFVGVATEDFLADWRQRAIDTSALVVIFLLATLLSSALLYRSLKRQDVAAEGMRDQKNFVDAILDNEPECVKVIAANGDILQMNQAGLSMLEVDSILEAKKSGLVSFILPEYRNAFMELGQRVFNGGSDELEFQIDGKKGTRRWLETHASPVRNSSGEIVALVGVTRDITERKKLEDMLKENELRYRTIADYTYDWEYWIMPDGKFRYVSPSCEQISGYTADEFNADPQLLPHIIHPDDLPLYTGHIHQITAQGIAEPIDFRILTKGGEIRWISHVCRPVYDQAGKHIGQRASNRDISDRKAAEEQIRNLAFYDTLTQLPNRRLLNDRLGQTMASSKRSGRYAALMFLDLDNFKPLNDTYGHDVGDLLLVEVARRINSCVREVDTVARFGGDEFVVMLSELDVDKDESTSQANIVAEKIRVLLAEPYHLKIQLPSKAESVVEHHCTTSIGVVVFNDYEALQDDILKWADLAMYQAKEDGRNVIRFFDPQSSSDANEVNRNAVALRLKWHESYKCKEPAIDQEHRKLFDLANSLIASAFTKNENSKDFDSAMAKLLAHIVQHFAHEEAILAQYHYAELDEHKQAHKLLIVHALHLRDKTNAGLVTIGELVNFIADEVIAQHMLKEDRKFYPLFNEVRLP